ncbi:MULTISPECIES: MHYT domain-containing protein [unclassified Novosphingobium]|uniref:MHYT domain-containing protein n=1 Tax=unclassified Novosphingobium TaxID=2644732 RepID=UPI001494BB12|nr:MULTISPECIES: MHYT domain-containing protein [unclassified Novosphingobium]MBB3357945.1 NO-binding membrane sensor protein with MHYT domain/signal transduction histidine kinase [Novosphingobium sp. BK256]MBB3374306.1 NO-binding membrane sensor protein with MHYT domain/signal transduction histidine kinase [Novosphingobium sp. BK280]MBB3378718.1 NO-binding membrane sensor protein with MHYT domain/signal transduction histidine kinase [Novosphingobium sp. BK258]MBB3420412.1 NO-binding membrane s
MNTTGTHEANLVILSILIAVFASFTALSLAGRVRVGQGWARRVWLAAASIALGGGIWSMHFVAMLAFRVPGMAMGYDLGLTLLSLAIAIGFTGAGFAALGRTGLSSRRIASAGLLMGLGVVAMHYVGMAAMRMPGTMHYDRLWVGISVLIAIGAATAALWFAARDQALGMRLGAAGLMGLAIAGMHYAGMHAAVITMDSAAHAHMVTSGIGQTFLAVLIATITLLILAIALGAAWLERVFHKIARREARIALRLKIADVLRDYDTTAALDEIAALMGEHFGVSRTGFGQLLAEEDVFDYDICWTDGTAPPLLGRMPAADFGARIVAALNRGETVVVGDLFAADPRVDARSLETARTVDTRAILVVPFLREGRLRTIVYLNSRTTRDWHPDDVAFMEEIAERTRLVSERAAIAEQLRELNATLEARVEARTSELRAAQEALVQSQKMEAMGQLVAGLSHDFNNVLGAILASFDLIARRSGDAARVERLAGEGRQAAQRAANLIAQLLAFSRTQRLATQALDPALVIERLRPMLMRTLGPLITLDCHLADPAGEGWAVLADPTQLEMAVLNLAVNGRDAMPAGGALTIALHPYLAQGAADLADGRYVMVEVADTGAGMDEETLRRAMEPFFTTKPVGKGTGLGLAQIYGSMRQIGGAVRIDSAPGQGTTVRLFLPRTASAAQDDDTPAAPAGPGTRLARVLLVDDDPDLRRALAAALADHGHVVDVAADGPAALALLERAQQAGEALPEVAAIDFAMPGMTGAELAAKLARHHPALRVVFMSGFADLAAIEAVAGPDVQVLRKPFATEQLINAVARAAG